MFQFLSGHLPKVSVAVIAMFLSLTDALKFIALGDWGVTSANHTKVNKRQLEVAKAMDTWAKNNGLDFVVTTGDNFYPHGAESPYSNQFRTAWENVYNNKPYLRGIQWYIAMGNHDYGGFKNLASGQEFNLLKRSDISETWMFPNLWHSFVADVGDSSLAHVIIVDTTALFHGLHDPESQVAWLRKEVALSTAEWKIVVGHHPVFCVGKLGPVLLPMKKLILPLVEDWGVDVYLSGHDHALQHFRMDLFPGVNFVVSGAGGKEPYGMRQQSVDILRLQNVRTEFFSSTNGFVGFTVENRTMTFEFVDHRGVVMQRFEVIK